MNRVILLVLEGFGIGALPDADGHADAGSNTLAHLAEEAGGVNLPTLESLGLGHLGGVRGLRMMAQPSGCFGRLAFQSKGCDSLLGNWELAGCLVTEQATDYSSGYPEKLQSELEQIFGKTLGNQVGFGPTVLRDLGKQHLSSKAPIVWTDGRRTCHVAAHETVLAADQLMRLCREARRALKEPWGILRVVAHPMTGQPGEWRHKPGRRDFAVEPPTPTMLDVLGRANQILIGVGKVGDLFSGRGFTRTLQSATWTAAFDEVDGMLNRVPRGLIYAGLDVFDDEPAGSVASLHEFDRRLPHVLEQLRAGDLLVVTGDHGRHPAKKHRLPTREYVPLLVTGPKLAQGVNLGARSSAADLGQTVVEALLGEPLPVGESFLDALRAG
jgi:phosphopentomutase